MVKIGLGAFDLECCIGRGGMGQVWRGVHRRTGPPVAVKILDADAALRPGTTDTCRDEARVVAGLDHPRIVTVREVGVVPGSVAAVAGGALLDESPYMVRKYAHQGTLESHLKEMAWPDIEAVLLALLDALAHAHARGVVHLGIKAGHIARYASQPQRAARLWKLTRARWVGLEQTARAERLTELLEH